MTYRYRRFIACAAIQMAVILLAPVLYAQSWQWGRTAGGPSVDITTGIGLDGAGNSYIVGTFDKTITFNTTVLDNGGRVGLFIAKYNPSGVLQWVVKGAGSGDFAQPSIAVGSNGEGYVAGSFSGTVSIGLPVLNSVGDFDMFLLRFDAAGDIKWARRGGGPEADFATGVALDTIVGDCLVTGTFRGTATFDTLGVTSAGLSDVFVAKYDFLGELKWLARNGSSNEDNAVSIAVNQAGSPYIIGHFKGDSLFGDTTGAWMHAGSTIFLAKYSSAGIFQWAKRAGGLSNDWVGHLSVDRFGSSYITGAFADSARFGDTVLKSAGGTDFFVAKYDGLGSPRWVRQGGGRGNDSGFAVTIDELGNTYITGMFRDTARVGDTVIYGNGNGDIFVAKYDGTGQFQWARSHGGSGLDQGRVIAIDKNAELRVGGIYSSSLAFGSTTITPVGQMDVFFAKLGIDPSITTEPISGSPFCAGTSIGVPFVINGIFDSENTFTAQLSDSAGSFASPMVIGSVQGTTSNVISGMVPLTITRGNRFRIRVVSNNPPLVGSDNGNDLVFNTAPMPTITVGGPLTICQGTAVMLDAGEGFTSYQWSNGAGTRTIAVSQEGSYSVTVANNDGCTGTSAPVTVVTKPAPAKPTITLTGMVLESSPADAYQWLRDNVVIDGATSRRYTADVTGNYAVRIFNTEGCTSVSDERSVTVAGVSGEMARGVVRVYPQPTSGEFTVELPVVGQRMVQLIVRNMVGEEVLRYNDESSGEHYRRVVDLRGAAPGMYFIEIESGTRRWTQEILKR